MRTPVWLTRSGTDQSPAEGELALVDGRIQLAFAGPLPKKTVQWLEEQQGESGLDERLKRGEPVTVLDVPRSEADAKFTSPVVTPGVRLRVDGQLWRLWFMKPGGPGAFKALVGAAPAAKAKRQWREALGA